MTDSSQFTDFSSKAKENLEQIKTSMLRHDRNPKDREFLNDIVKSVRSINKAALPLNLKNTTQLCKILDNLITLIRDEKKELRQEIIILFAMSRDRLSKLAFELDTVHKERTNVKDLIRKIQEQIDLYNNPEQAEAEIPEKKASPSPKASEESLLPEEIVNKDYDEELFQIYIEQLQENISLLRYLTENFADEENKSTIINQCSDLVSKLQSSANYMGYDRLAEYYLQWVAELEMVGVDLSMGLEASFDFMDEKIKKIAGLFPDVEDKPADPSALHKLQRKTSQPEKEEKAKEPILDEEPPTIAALGGVEDEGIGEEEEEEPIAALAAETPPEELEPEPALDMEEERQVKRKLSPQKVIELDASFLKEEMQSEDFDEELFQIFSQQLQENLSQLRELTDSFPQAKNKSDLIVQCSNFVSKLQASANYMGYERLAEYYLQWIAELEMSGVEISIGTEVSFDFMAEKIDQITRLFLEGEEAAEEAAQAPPKQVFTPPPEKEAPRPAQLAETKKEEPLQEPEEDTFSLDESELDEAGFDFLEADSDKLGSLFTNIEDNQEEDEEFEETFEAIAGLRADIEEEEELEETFEPIAGLRADIEEEEEPLLPVKEYDDIHYDDEEEEEELAEGVEPVAGLSDAGFLETLEGEETLPLEERLKEEASGATTDEKSFGEEFSDALNTKLEDFFKEVGEPEEAEGLEESFMEIASMSDDLEEEEPSDMEGVAAVAEFAEQDETKTPGPQGETEEIFDEVSALFDESLGEEETAEPSPKPSPIQEEITIGDEVEELFADAVETTTEEIEEKVAGEGSEEVDESMESFFADMGEPEEAEEVEAPTEAAAELTAEEAEAEPVAGEFDELFTEEELHEEPEKEAPGEFAEEVEETMESFFADIGEPEEAKKVEAPTEAAAELTAEEAEAEPVAGEFDDLFTEDEELHKEPEEEEAPGEFAEEVEETMESFFADIGEPEEAEEVEAPTEAAAELTKEEAEVEPVAGEFEELFEDEVSEEEKPSEEVLTDEELLREIEGPTVGEEISDDRKSFYPDIEAADEAVSAISEEELSEEELFKKLEGAISAEDKEAEDIYAATGGEEVLDTAPERKELYQKLTDALHELDEETGLPEEEYEEDHPATEQAEESGLYEMLSSALEVPESKDSLLQKSFDHVLEEILTGSFTETKEERPVEDLFPRKLTADEIKQIIQMDSGKVDALLERFGELNANRFSFAHLLTEMKDLHQHYQKLDGLSKQELKPLKEIIFKLGDANISLTRVANELREGIVRVRMVPISLLFERYHDFVANLAAKSNKEIELNIVGGDTELEKIVLDEISEPLTNLIVNAVEHGIETVDERKALGKNETGNIKLVAYQEDNEIVIEIMDNGQGIDLAKVKARALQLGLFDGDDLYKFSEQELREIILAPGFSFEDSRGEGLHIVKTNIENINGAIDIRSTAGRGTIIQVRFPFSLLVVKALKVNIGNEVMALPVTGIEEIIRINQDKVINKDGKQFIEFNETMIPLYRMSEIFDIETAEKDEEKLNIIIVASRQRSIALIVDATDGLEEIVIKPLGETLRKKSGFAGATIISDGEISLVPDIDEIISIAENQQNKIEETMA